MSDIESDEYEYMRQGDDTDPDADVSEMRPQDARARIGRKVGTHERPGTPLSINTLNSAYAYFFGEFACQPMEIGTPMSPGRPRLRAALAVHVEMDAYPYDGSRPYREAELRELVRALAQADDLRSWTPGDG